MFPSAVVVVYQTEISGKVLVPTDKIQNCCVVVQGKVGLHELMNYTFKKGQIMLLELWQKYTF